MPLSGCTVTVNDDVGNTYLFAESQTPGIYNSDKESFRGIPGRKYKLRVETNYATQTHYSYESEPVELKAVPQIDSLYYEKVLINEATPTESAREGCRIYLNTNDPDGICRFYRWDFSETWKIEIPYLNAFNRYCWISDQSQKIDIKSTLVLSEDRISRHPITYISNNTDRLSIRYSIIVNQYSISENEFAYWDKIRNVTQDVGGLYDVVPSSINGNLFCIENPGEPVLGYFSVSGKTSKRIFIDETFYGLENPYIDCCRDTIITGDPASIDGLNEYIWICSEGKDMHGKRYVTITYSYNCVDCTIRGSKIRPDFWEDW